MTTLLPKDADNNPIPALRLRSGGAHVIAATNTSARNSVAFDEDTRVISIFTTGPVYLKFGGASVTATNTDHYFPNGIYYDFAISGGNSKGPLHTHVAVLRADGDCSVYISEKE